MNHSVAKEAAAWSLVTCHWSRNVCKVQNVGLQVVERLLPDTEKPHAGLLQCRLLPMFSATKPLCDPGTIIHAATGGHEWCTPYFLNYLQA